MSITRLQCTFAATRYIQTAYAASARETYDYVSNSTDLCCRAGIRYLCCAEGHTRELDHALNSSGLLDSEALAAGPHRVRTGRDPQHPVLYGMLGTITGEDSFLATLLQIRVIMMDDPWLEIDECEGDLPIQEVMLCLIFKLWVYEASHKQT